MTCYYIENAHKNNRNYDSYVPVEQMKEVLTAAMLQTAIEKFGKGEFTRKQFDELRENFRVKLTKKYFRTGIYCYGGRWNDVDFNETQAPMSFETLKERGVFTVERFEEFDIETEDSIVAGKRNFYKMNVRKAWNIISEMADEFASNTLKSCRTIKRKTEDISEEIRNLQEMLRCYESILDDENAQGVELVRDSYDNGWMSGDDCEKEFDKFVSAVIEKHAA